MEQRLNIITLGVSDLKKSRQFYENVLGWKISSASNQNICFIQLNSIILGLYPRKSLAEDACVKDEKSEFGGITLAYNTYTKNEVDDILLKVQNAGAKILKNAQDVFWGGYSGYFSDPDGYPWEVAWNPFFSMDNKGNVQLP